MIYKTNSINLYYLTKGKNDPFIILHGWGCSHLDVEILVNFLCKNFKVYVLDFPGFGFSKEPIKPLGIPFLAEMLNNFITDLNIKNPIILGHSYGGRVGIEYASRYDNISKLILLSSAGIKHHYVSNTIEIKKYKLKKWYYKKTHQVMKYNTLVTTSGSNDYKNASLVHKKMLSLAVNYNQKKSLKKIKVETLIIWGENDNVTPLKDAYLMHKKIKSSGLVIVPNAGHFVYLDNFDYLQRVLNSYLLEGKGTK